MTLHLDLSYLLAKSAIPFTSVYAVYSATIKNIFSKNIVLT